MTYLRILNFEFMFSRTGDGQAIEPQALGRSLTPSPAGPAGWDKLLAALSTCARLSAPSPAGPAGRGKLLSLSACARFPTGQISPLSMDR
jgi:hypothetical protein